MKPLDSVEAFRMQFLRHLNPYRHFRCLLALAALSTIQPVSAAAPQMSASQPGSDTSRSTFNLYPSASAQVPPLPAWPASPVAGDAAVSDNALDFYVYQHHPRYDWSDYTTEIGDINGDGNDDIVWNATGNNNRIFVGLGTSSGRFQFQPPQDHAGSDWASFDTKLDDINGDGRDDIIWNSTRNTNRVYVGLGTKTGRFNLLAPQQHPARDWSGYETYTGDVNGDGYADLIWNLTTHANRIFVGLGSVNGHFEFGPMQVHPATDWHGYDTHVGDINGDGRTDLIWNSTSNTNRLYIGLGSKDGRFVFKRQQDHPMRDWSGFETNIGDVNGDGREDVIWNSTASQTTLVAGLGTRSGRLLFLPPQRHPATDSSARKAQLADINGDGLDDIVWNSENRSNSVYISLGTVSGRFIFKSGQRHPRSDWSDYDAYVADVNGDGFDDLVWNATGSVNRIYHGRSIQKAE